jgi:hypothetical protein
MLPAADGPEANPGNEQKCLPTGFNAALLPVTVKGEGEDHVPTLFS